MMLGPIAGAALAVALGGMTTVSDLQETDPSQLTPLDSAQIEQSLVGSLVVYAPLGWSDAGVHEEFHEDGSWNGIRYSRGPIPFSGRWAVRDDKLCVEAGSEFLGPPSQCRTVWRNLQTGHLLMDHAMGDPGPMVLTVKPLTR